MDNTLRKKQVFNLGFTCNNYGKFFHGPFEITDMEMYLLTDDEWNEYLQQMIPFIKAYDLGTDISVLIKNHSNDNELGAAVRRAYAHK